MKERIEWTKLMHLMQWWCIDDILITKCIDECIDDSWTNALTMDWWFVDECIDNALMNHWWCIIEGLMMHWWIALMMHWWIHWLIHWWCIDKCTDDALMMKGRTEWTKLMHLMQWMHWWCMDGALRMHW